MELLHSEILFGDKSGTVKCEIILRNNNKIIYSVFDEIRSNDITTLGHIDYIRNIIPTFYFNPRLIEYKKEVILNSVRQYVNGYGSLSTYPYTSWDQNIVTSLGTILIHEKLHHLINENDEYYIVPDTIISTNTYVNNLNLLDKL